MLVDWSRKGFIWIITALQIDVLVTCTFTLHLCCVGVYSNIITQGIYKIQITLILLYGVENKCLFKIHAFLFNFPWCKWNIFELFNLTALVQQDLAYFQVFSNGKKLCLKYQSVENNQEHVSNSLFNMYNFQILFKIHHFDWSCWFVITNLKFITIPSES